MTGIFEIIMLLCFGISWPISVVKSIRSKSTNGKSIVFICVILLGYVAGIMGKIVNNQLTYVLAFYCLNLAIVCVDLCVWIVNRRRELNESKKEA